MKVYISTKIKLLLFNYHTYKAVCQGYFVLKSALKIIRNKVKFIELITKYEV